MTIAERFRVALDGAAEPDLVGPALLPVRLARACARMLPVDGAGLSILDGERRRMPLGASSTAAEVAERLQFTVGAGPCAAAADTRQPVFAVEEDLRRRWPVFFDLLCEATPYRAVVALPLQPDLTGFGAIDLFFERSDDVVDLDVFEALAVGELAGSALSEASVWSSWPATEGPEWLNGPASLRRAAVWEAMGKVGVDLEIGPVEALARLRAVAYGSGRAVDDVAADLLAGRMRPADLT